jgi:ABC-type oligopeptide transport system ATPase subunit
MSLIFEKIIHQFIRHNQEVDEKIRAKKALVWGQNHTQTLKNVLEEAEYKIVETILIEGSNNNGEASGLVSIQNILETSTAQPGVMEAWAEYSEATEGLPLWPSADLDQLIREAITQFRTERDIETLRTAKKILVGAHTDPKTKKEVRGPEAAEAYLQDYLAKAMADSPNAPEIRRLRTDSYKVLEDYDKTLKDKRYGSHIIPSGISVIDNILPIRRGQLVGILGAAGSYKTTIARTICYNASAAGFKVLYVPLEISVEEESRYFVVQHAQRIAIKPGTSDDDFDGYSSITKMAIDNDILSPMQMDYLENTINDITHNCFLEPPIYAIPSGKVTWSKVAALAEQINRESPLDMLIVDYPALLNMEGTRDKREYMETAIQEMKIFAKRFAENRGIAVVVPIQANRTGKKAAMENGGIWDMSAIFNYSEFEKSCDTIFSAYQGERINEDGEPVEMENTELLVGSVKERGGPKIKPPHMVHANHDGGYLYEKESDRYL